MNPRDARLLAAHTDPQRVTAQLVRQGVTPSSLRRRLRSGDGYRPVDPMPSVQQRLTCQGRVTTMAVRVPESYRETRPGVLIVLHGAGGTGAAMLPYFEGLGERLGLAVLCPDAGLLEDVSSNIDVSGIFTKHFRFPRWSFRRYDFPMAALRWALDHLDADPDRCVLVGLSMGGLACWNLAMRLWPHFAAAVPINGALSMWEAFGSDRRTRYLLPNVTTLPMFVVHGGSDDRISPQFDRMSTTQLWDLGHRNLTYVEVPDGGHPLSTLHFEATGDLVTQLERWLTGRRRVTDPTVVRHRTLDDQHGRAHWVGLDQVNPDSGAAVVAARIADDIFSVDVSGAGLVRLYLTGDRLEPGQAVTVHLNGRPLPGRFEPTLTDVLGTFREHRDPALTAEAVVTFEVPGPPRRADGQREDTSSRAVTT